MSSDEVGHGPDRQGTDDPVVFSVRYSIVEGPQMSRFLFLAVLTNLHAFSPFSREADPSSSPFEDPECSLFTM
jgi:hypothetical protein